VLFGILWPSSERSASMAIGPQADPLPAGEEIA